MTCMSVHFNSASRQLLGNRFLIQCARLPSKYGRIAQPEPHLPQITGGLFLCPALAIQGDSRPGMAVELVARAISSFAGAAPIASANKGKNSEDPTCGENLSLPYLMSSSLIFVFALLQSNSLNEIRKRIMAVCESALDWPFSKPLRILPSNARHWKFRLPYFTGQGTGQCFQLDPLWSNRQAHAKYPLRVTSYHGSEQLFKEAVSTNKEIKLYEGYEHICEPPAIFHTFLIDSYSCLTPSTAYGQNRGRRQASTGCDSRYARFPLPPLEFPAMEPNLDH